jgi:arylsulfatase A-like enzyme
MRVLVLAAPGLRTSYLGCYGCDWVRTPNIDRLASEGIVFDQHYADTPSPRSRFRGPSDIGPNRSGWTGMYFFPIGKQTPSVDKGTDLVTLLGMHGGNTVHIVARSRMADAAKTPSLKFPRKRVLAVLAEQASSPSSLTWVDLPSLEPPWPRLLPKRFRPYFPAEAAEDEQSLTPWTDPPLGKLDPEEEGAWERLQATYAAMVTYFDAQLGKLFQELRAHNAYDDVLLIVTADRGLGLGEHGYVGFATPTLHEEFIHLPLLLRLPDGVEGGRRVSALTQPVDLLPTLLDAMNRPKPEVHGGSLLPLLRGEVESVRSYVCAGVTAKGEFTYALRTPEWSFLAPAAETAEYAPQLFVKPDDCWEVNNVVQHHQELAQRLEQTLREFVTATREPGPFRPPELSVTPAAS